MEVKVGVKGVARELVIETDLEPTRSQPSSRAVHRTPRLSSILLTPEGVGCWCQQTSSPTSRSASRRRAASASARCRP